MKILLLGANGQLGKELERQLSSVANVAAFPRESLDITNHNAVRDAVRCVRPNIIVNAAAYTAVDKAETDADFAHAINADAVANLAQIAREQSLWLFHYSTDYVFDGSKQSPYLETDTPNPINVYGASKLAGETAIAAADCQHLIFRTTWVIGKDGHNFAKTILRLASERDALKVIVDQIGVPTSPSLITRVTIDAIRAIKDRCAWPQGIYHLAPKGKTSWHEIAQTLIAYAEQQHVPLRTHVSDIQAITTAEYPTAAKRPLNSQLDTHKLRSQLSFDLPHWKDDFLDVARDIVKELETV
ncbi:dTDP-4-dehydrorhamnose reductase [Rhodobacteraceae bacterium XHP0102]|nr:dTDP-4-dehydrorhamnose reductase [Rhodobacteraceae bacterium XHP0102]